MLVWPPMSSPSSPASFFFRFCVTAIFFSGPRIGNAASEEAFNEGETLSHTRLFLSFSFIHLEENTLVTHLSHVKRVNA